MRSIGMLLFWSCVSTILQGAMHFAAMPLLRHLLLPRPCASRLDCLEPHLSIKLAKIVRSTTYDYFALVCGVILISRCASLWDMCHLYTPLHEFAFLVAIGHWVVSFVEDLAATSRSFAIRVPRSEQPRAVRSFNGAGSGRKLQIACLLHHATAALAFAFCLRTHLLGGMGAIGLLYEGPVIFMNLREVLVDFDPTLGLLRELGGETTLRWTHVLLHLLFVPCRIGSDCFYLYSLWRYDAGLGTLPKYAQVREATVAVAFLPCGAPGTVVAAFLPAAPSSLFAACACAHLT
jgi:hypothetical protein